MILKGSRRGGGLHLAHHLMNAEDNEHVRVHDIRGFTADTIAGAFTEAYAISKGTRCRKYLFSLSLNPPEKQSVPVEVFEKAIDEIEEKLGYAGHPRVVVFHEKEGRRHAHCVWSRIDVHRMRAVDPSFEKLKLRDKSRELYLEHGWVMPRGLMNSEERDPLNFSMAELQQARRAKQDVRQVKETFVDCWAVSDGRAAFAQALEERGYYLARGRRGHVAVDWRGEVYAISQWVGVRAKAVRAKIGDPSDLPNVEQTKKRISERFSDRIREYAIKAGKRHEKRAAALDEIRREMKNRHRKARDVLAERQRQRRLNETKQRAVQLPKGLKALWFRLTGRYEKLKVQIERYAVDCARRDEAEVRATIDAQLSERQRLQHEIRQHRHLEALTIKRLNREVAELLALERAEQELAISRDAEAEFVQRRGRSRRAHNRL
ncbi:MAG: relaxase/mobilization nuclease domain-containing protein [Devosia sp.]